MQPASLQMHGHREPRRTFGSSAGGSGYGLESSLTARGRRLGNISHGDGARRKRLRPVRGECPGLHRRTPHVKLPIMKRLTALLPLGLLAGCFNPTESVDADTEDGPATSGETDPEGSTASATTGRDPTTGQDTDQPETTADATSGPATTDTTVGDTESETTIGAACIESSDCETGVCVEMECVPCSDADDPDAACEEADPNSPFCGDDATTCVACTASSCDGSTPACAPEEGCVACTEHSQCPDSACHLGGPEQGSCFDVADVVEVSDTDEFEQAFVQGNPGGQLVIRLAPGTIQIAGSLVSDLAEVALLGSDSAFTGGATSLFFNIPDLFYVSNVTIEDGPSRAITCSPGEQLWLEDTSISNYTVALQSSCDVQVRRSQFRGNPGGPGGPTLQLGGSFTAENTDFGPAGDPMFLLSDAEIDIRYSTIAGNQTGIECDGNSSGVIRNSIITNVGASVFSTCGLSYIDNAIDEEFFGGTVVPSYNPDWFTISNGSRFFLSPSGEEVFEGIADWDDGDPVVDIEGDPRPQDGPGFPGVDEPVE